MSWIDDVKRHRGIVTGRVDTELYIINRFGSYAFKEDMLHEKRFGIKYGSEIILTLTREEQDEFLRWKAKKKRTLLDIKSYMLKF